MVNTFKLFLDVHQETLKEPPSTMSSNLLRLLSALVLCFTLSSGQDAGCYFEGIWHSLGDYFPVLVSEGNVVNYLCTGTGMVAIGCGLPNIGGYRRDNNVEPKEQFSIPFGIIRLFGCEEFECLEESGWTPTGNRNPDCEGASSTMGDGGEGASSTMGDGVFTTGGKLTTLGTNGPTTFGAYTT